MKQLILITYLTIFLFAFCVPLLAQTNPHHVYVKGYTRKNGTYVQGYYRTAPNSTNRDNFSTKGNYNPYTGKAGWIEPDNKDKPTYNYQSNPVYSQLPNSTYQQSSTVIEKRNVLASVNSETREVYSCSSILDRPTSNAKEIGRACDGKVYILEKYNAQYYKVSNASTVGYLPVTSFKVVSNAKQNTNTFRYTYADDKPQKIKQPIQKVVSVSETHEVISCAIIYNKPDKNTAKEIGRACNGFVYLVKMVNDNYYRINYGSAMGYIHRNSLK